MVNPILHNVSLKKLLANQKKLKNILLNKPNQPLPYSAHGGQDIENSLSEPCAKVRHPVPKLSKKLFTTSAEVAGTNCRYVAIQTSEFLY